MMMTINDDDNDNEDNSGNDGNDVNAIGNGNIFDNIW